MTAKEQLQSEVEELDERTAELLLSLVRDVISPSTTRSSDPSSLDDPQRPVKSEVHVDRESLRRIARPITDDDPLWGIVGLLDDDGPSDMSSNKHKYLAEIYGDLHEK